MAGQTIAAAYVAILPSFSGGAAAIGAEMDGPLAAAGTAGGKKYGGGMKTSIAGMAKSVFAPLLAIGATVMVGKFFSGAIKEASGLNESVNALNVSYGGASQGVQALGKSAAQNLGLSNLEFNNLAVRFSSFSKTIAGDGGDVTGTLKDLTGRASDFASVMNLDVSEAAQLFQSGLAGESEPLRKYGLDMSAASVEAYGLANGLAANGKSLTESEKIQARYGYLMEQTSNTQGDFANTSDQLANKQRITAAEFDNVKARIGTGLLPIMSALVGFVGGTLLPSLDSVGSFLTETLIPGVQSFVRWIDNAKVPLGVVAAVVAAVFLPAMALVVAGWISAGAAAIASGAETAAIWLMYKVEAIKGAAAHWGSMARVVAGWVTSAAAAVASGAQTVAIWALYKIEAVKGAATTVASHARMAGAWLASKATAVASMAITVAAMVVGWAVMGVQALLGAAKIALAWLIALGPVGIVIAAVVGLGVLIALNFERIKGWIGGAWEWIKRVTITAWNAIGTFLAGLWTSITSTLTSAWNGIVRFFSAIPGRVGAFFTMVKDKIVEVFGWTPLGLIIENWDGIMAFLGGLPASVGGAISGLWDGLWTSFKGALNNIIGAWNDFSITMGGGTTPWGAEWPSFTLNTPNIPYLASGALVTNPALAMLGESGSEAVLPFSRVDEFAAMVARQMGQMDAGPVSGRGRDLIDYDRLARAMANVNLTMDGRRVSQSADAWIGASIR